VRPLEQQGFLAFLGLAVERFQGREPLLVDGGDVLSSATQLRGATVSARVIGETKGPKIDGFTYKNKTNQRKRWGHRQQYATIEITGITKG